MRPIFLALLALWVLALFSALHAATPAQFSAWGSVCPPLRPVPAGWTLVEKPLPPWPAPTAEETARGYQLTIDPGCGAGDELRATAAQGEYEPVSFVIHALQELKNATVHLDPLAGRRSAAKALNAEWVDVRVVRRIPVPVDPRARTYRMEELVLEKVPALSLPEGGSARIWLTIKAPPAEGDYTGQVQIITSNSRPIHQVALRLRVLPFALPPAGAAGCKSSAPGQDEPPRLAERG